MNVLIISTDHQMAYYLLNKWNIIVIVVQGRCNHFTIKYLYSIKFNLHKRYDDSQIVNSKGTSKKSSANIVRLVCGVQKIITYLPYQVVSTYILHCLKYILHTFKGMKKNNFCVLIGSAMLINQKHGFCKAQL